MEKVDVNGESAAALFKYLKEQKSAIPLIHDIKANFEKFLVDKNGQVIEHYSGQGLFFRLPSTRHNQQALKPRTGAHPSRWLAAPKPPCVV